jgi:hypothetical protein
LGVPLRVALSVPSPRSPPLALQAAVGFPLQSLTQNCSKLTAYFQNKKNKKPMLIKLFKKNQK